MTIKKKPIGFSAMNETKSKVSDETDSKEDTTKSDCQIPSHIVNEIEEHVLAKQEYEKALHYLFMFKQAFKVFLLFCAFALSAFIFYCGYKTAENDIAEKLEKERVQKQLLEQSYLKGYNDGKLNKQIAITVTK